MKSFLLRALRHRFYINGIVIFILLCFLLQCYLQVITHQRWERDLHYGLEHHQEVRLSAPSSYSYLGAIHVLPNLLMNDGPYLPLYVEGILFFILLCGLLSNFIQKNHVAIVRGFMGMIFLEKLFATLLLGWSLLNTPPDLTQHPEIIGILTKYIAFNLLFMFLAWLVLIYYKNTRKIEHEVYETNGIKTISIIPSSSGKRLLNHLLDTFIFTLLMAKHIYFIAEKWHSDGSPLLFVAVVLLMIFMYYFLMELLFSATPGKLFTSCCVIDQHGEEPGFFKILVRSICRFIPFDHLSFFFNANWHDQLSATWVVGDVTNEENPS